MGCRDEVPQASTLTADTAADPSCIIPTQEEA